MTYLPIQPICIASRNGDTLAWDGQPPVGNAFFARRRYDLQRPSWAGCLCAVAVVRRAASISNRWVVWP